MACRAPAKCPGGVPAGDGDSAGRPGRLPDGRPYLTLRNTASIGTAETLRNTASLGTAEREQRPGRS
jgi:hypothetical protein